jgi:hypothetical protein
MFKHPKYPKGNIYLSGGMEHAANFGEGWRAITSVHLKRMGYYPLDIAEFDKAYAKAHGKEIHNFSVSDKRSILLRKANIRKHYVETDLNLIKFQTDALIVYYDESARRGAGTISECQYAYLLDLPIFLVSKWENWELEVPGWLHALSTKVFTNFDELYKYLEQLPDGILKRDRYGNRHSGEYYLCSLSGEPFKKTKTHFVSKISPLYSKESVDVVREVNEKMKDRYEFFLELLEDQIDIDTKE